jgi:hypothetical protein
MIFTVFNTSVTIIAMTTGTTFITAAGVHSLHMSATELSQVIIKTPIHTPTSGGREKPCTPGQIMIKVPEGQIITQ